MSDISKIKPYGSTGAEYTIKDANAQPKTLATPISVGGVSKTTVESALQALNLGFYIDNDGDLCQS